MASETHHRSAAFLNGPNEGAYALLAAQSSHIAAGSTVNVKANETDAARLVQ